MSVSGSARLWQTLIYLVRIPRRDGHSIQCIVLAGWLRSLRCLSVAASTVAPRVGSYGRDLERLDSRSDRTTADESLFVVNSLHHSGGHLLRDGDNVLQWTRPGRRIGLCWEATRAPSQGPSSEIGAVTHRPTPFPLRDWHPSDKSRGLGQSPRRTTTDSPSLPAILLITCLGSPWPASLRRPRGLGTGHTFFSWSACAR